MSGTALHEPAGAAAQGAGSPARIRVRGLVKRFGTLEVFRGIDFDLGEREIVTIVGPSGLRQDHAAALHRRPDPGRRRRDLVRATSA